MARFEREAKVLASLNHPNIAQIYGVEERALVMELVEGETLKGHWRLRQCSITQSKWRRRWSTRMSAASFIGI
jgi:serine/threonine protein kinase